MEKMNGFVDEIKIIDMHNFCYHKRFIRNFCQQKIIALFKLIK